MFYIFHLMEPGQYLEVVARTQINSDNNRVGNLERLTGKWVHCVRHDGKNMVVH